MSDIDFDELDKAVASALGGSAGIAPIVDSVPSAPSAPAGATLATPAPTELAQGVSSHAGNARIMTGARPSRMGMPARTSAATSASSEPAAAAPRKVIPHREGRFMDVVRPSRTVKPSVAADTPLSLPVRPEAGMPSAAAVADSAPIATTPELPLADAGIPSSVAEASVMSPTPEIDVTDSTYQAAGSVDEVAAALVQPIATDEQSGGSPFLSGAKVEKRPLGNGEADTFAPASLAVDDFVGVASEASIPEPTPLVEASIAEEITVPEEVAEELHSAVVAVESSEIASPEDDEPAVVAEESLAVDQKSTAPVSIARQYKDSIKTASEDDVASAIFDPQTYHQPAEEPVKKSSALKWILLATLLLLVVAVVGVAIYMGGIVPVAL